MVNPVSSRLTGSCSFLSKLGMLSGQLSVSLSASNPLSVGDTGVGLSIGSSPASSRLLLMGNR